MTESLFTGSQQDWNLSNKRSGCAFKDYKPLELKGEKNKINNGSINDLKMG